MIGWEFIKDQSTTNLNYDEKKKTILPKNY